MTHEEFQEKVKAIPDQELAEMAHKALSKLCSTGGQSFTMTVPPRIDDTDIILAEVIIRFEVQNALNKISSKPMFMLADKSGNFPCLNYLHGQDRCTEQCEDCKP